MAQLIAIGYRDTTGAAQAAVSARELAAELAFESDSIATVVCATDRTCEACTAYNLDRRGQWGRFWSDVVSSALLGTASVDRRAPASRLGAGINATMFIWQVGQMLEPQTSALLLAGSRRDVRRGDPPLVPVRWNGPDVATVRPSVTSSPVSTGLERPP